MSNTAKSLWEQEASQTGLYSGLWGATGGMGEHWEVVSRAKRREAGTSDEGDGSVRRE